ncbi:HD domain-containing protein [bacterium]|nr:HD domain-containing protein [bacterium]
MTIGTQFIQMEVGVSELSEDMLIKAYTGFDNKYSSMEEKTVIWIQHNFKGASCIVERNGEKKSIPIEQVNTGDTLQMISKLPSSLISIAQVSKPLALELERRGFLRFKVQKAVESEGTAEEGVKIAKDHANQFVKRVKESISMCKQATEAVENLLDSARQGKADTGEIKAYVDSMTSSESADAIGAIISLKDNDQVYAHCIDVGVIFQTTYFEIVKLRGETAIFKDEKEAMLAAFLHDIGKAKVPKEILNSTAPFKKNSREMELIRTHPETGAKMLASMGMPDYFCNMAHYHHVKLDSTMASSYPKDVKDEEIIFATRLLALVDAYQALTAGRSYKKSWTPPAVMRYLDATAGVEFDLNLWQDFQKVMGHYPRGSFVKLSDGTYGFVMTVPDKDVLRPQVAIVRNANDEDLQNQYLVDLQIEKDLSITQDIDAKSIYQNKALEVLSDIKIS